MHAPQTEAPSQAAVPMQSFAVGMFLLPSWYVLQFSQVSCSVLCTPERASAQSHCCVPSTSANHHSTFASLWTEVGGRGEFHLADNEVHI